jgi:cytochrome P450
MNVPHRTTQQMTVGDYILPEGTTIVPQISVVHMDEKHFSNPKIFDPDRFLQSDGRTLKKVDQFIPFSLGKRQCMGKSLACMELFLIFANFLHNFKVFVSPGRPAPSLQPIFGQTVQPGYYTCSVAKLNQ